MIHCEGQAFCGDELDILHMVDVFQPNALVKKKLLREMRSCKGGSMRSPHFALSRHSSL
jgi:hypothetical protein